MLGGSQMTLMPESTPAVELAGGIDYGEVFTRRWVVELILDLCGYASDRDLAAMRVIEPACGSGAFLVPLVERLAESARLRRRDLSGVDNAIRALDIREVNVLRSRARVSQVLVESGLNDNAARALAAKWVRQGDFLLEPPAERSADLVIGNPPYIRLESVRPATSQAYRLSCPTMGGRADIYIGFYERGLRALRDNGILGFICADRWMRNAYGARPVPVNTNETPVVQI
jgi:adenine-specific DNA-methyltransferase